MARSMASPATQTLKLYSEQAASLLRDALRRLEEQEAAEAGGGPVDYSNYNYSSLSSAGGGGGGGAASRRGGHGSSGVIGIRGRAGGPSAAAKAAAASGGTSGAFSSDDEGKDGGGGGPSSQSSSDSSSSSSSSEDEYDNVGALPNHSSAAAAAQAGALTDEYDASASSAGEMSLVSSPTARTALPPRRSGGAGGGAGGAARYNRAGGKRRAERNSRRNKGGGGGGGDNVADAVRAMGAPPSVLVPLQTCVTDGLSSSSRDDDDGGGGTNKDESGGDAPYVAAASIPAALLPPGNASWDAVTVCRSCLDLSDDLRVKGRPVVVILLRSGRFAGGVFRGDRCLVHRACARYTVRRGQGGAQSSLDSSKGKAKSMGAQLRRAGEAGLREDVATALAEWRTHVEDAALILLSCPKTMRKGLHDEGSTAKFLPRDDGRIRKVPLDFGRPTYESASAVYEIMMRITVRPMTDGERRVMESTSYELSTEAEAEGEGASGSSAANGVPHGKKLPSTMEDDAGRKAKAAAVAAAVEPIIPPTPLHEAVTDADLARLAELLSLNEGANEKDDDGGDEEEEHMIDVRAGEEHQTPLHLASALPDADAAAECVTALLIDGGANPCVVDSRNRPPYFVASHEKVRDAFRTARATLGEDHCDWDGGAKVGPPLTKDDVQRRKEKAAEKKRRQRARQKEKKSREKAEAEERERKAKEEEERKKEEEDAKRVRAGLKPKATSANNACDFCQKICRGKKRSQMFSRLEYVYCSTDCVKKHQRELTAAAAMARLGG